jgi:hypothetical protein
MKKLALSFGLFLAASISYSQCAKYREYAPLQLSVNYGTLASLGGEVLYQNDKNIFGFGYAGFIGENTGNLSLDQSNYHFKNETLYLTYQRQIDYWVIGVRIGKQNTADWNKKVLSYSSNGNPNSYTFEKDANEYTMMYGGSIGYLLSDEFRINIGADTFSTVTLGFTVGF